MRPLCADREGISHSNVTAQPRLARSSDQAVKLATETAAANMEAAIKAGTVTHIEDEEVVGVLNESR